MPVYTCTTTTSTLTADVKSAVAQRSAESTPRSTTCRAPCQRRFPRAARRRDLHRRRPADPVLVNSWVRSGHPADKTTRLATEIAAAVSRIANVDPDRVMMVIQNSPASGAVEGGRVLPEPGQEQAWIAGA